MTLFRNAPMLGAALLEGIGVNLHADRAELGHTDLSELRPTERRADIVIHTWRGEAPGPTLVVEVQGDPDEDKRFTWPQYLCSQRAALRRDVLLVVLTLDERTARWAGRPISTGHPGFTLIPLVIGPSHIPLITDPAAAARLPELTVISTLAHVGHPDTLAAARLALDTAATLDAPRAEMYADIVLWALCAAAPAVMEVLMQQRYEFKSEFARHYIGLGKEEGREEGREEGQRRLLRQLAHRYGPLPSWVEPLVLSAASAELDRWAEEIFEAPTLEGLLGHTT